MNPCPCVSLCPPSAMKRRPRPVLPALLTLALLFAAATSAQADDDDRGLGSAPARHVIVKAVGQGVTAAEAEQDALRSARRMAAKHYAALGGAAALDTSPQGQRVLATHHSPPMGLASVRSVVLVEMRLKPLPEPPPAALALPVLRAGADGAHIQVEANRACEAMVGLDFGDAAEPEILPGGGGAAYRLAPGKPMRQPLPKTEAPASLRVLACTGGLFAPAAAPSLDEAFAKARAGKPRPTILQGVVSECVEVRPARPGPPDMIKRSLRQKGSQAPVNMSGAAGREAGLPIPASPARDLP